MSRRVPSPPDPSGTPDQSQHPVNQAAAVKRCWLPSQGEMLTLPLTLCSLGQATYFL